MEAESASGQSVQRYYDPMIPRFLSVDPVTAYSDPIGAFHRYRYGANNPYRFVDPDGREHYDPYLLSGGAGNSAGLGSDSTPTRNRRTQTAVPLPVPAPGGLPLPIPGPKVGEALVAGVEALADAYGKNEEQRVWVTYILTKPGFPHAIKYFGRASGFGTPKQVMMSRFATHERRLLGYGNPILDQSGIGESGRLAIRGREQQLIDAAGGVGSYNVGNFIRGVSMFNRNGRVYHEASNLMFGPLAGYTGF